MMRQSEFKKRYDPDMGKFSRQHIYGGGVMDTVKSFFGKKPTKKVNFAVKPPVPPKPTPPNTNENVGDKIVKILSAEKNKRKGPKMTQQ